MWLGGSSWTTRRPTKRSLNAASSAGGVFQRRSGGQVREVPRRAGEQAQRGEGFGRLHDELPSAVAVPECAVQVVATRFQILRRERARGSRRKGDGHASRRLRTAVVGTPDRRVGVFGSRVDQPQPTNAACVVAGIEHGDVVAIAPPGAPYRAAPSGKPSTRVWTYARTSISKSLASVSRQSPSPAPVPLDSPLSSAPASRSSESKCTVSSAPSAKVDAG